MRLKVLAGLLAAAVLSLPAAAQEQRATLEGLIIDPSGAPVPGATVEARSVNGGVLNAVSDTSGAYRFPSVAPGRWDITATLAGFRSARAAGVSISLGQTLRVNLTLAVGAMTEEVTVTSETPLIDVAGSGRTTSIRDEAIQKLPKGRDFTTLVTQAPGVNSETKLGGISVDQASVA